MATRVLFVCLGNICRSPTAEGVMRDLIRREGLEGEIEVDSAGTGGWHVGAPPDERSTAAAAARDIVLDGAARKVTHDDFEDFDLLVAMDRDNLANLRRMAPGDEERGRVRLLLADGQDVPDPYYGGEDGFDHVLDLVEAACRELLEELRA